MKTQKILNTVITGALCLICITACKKQDDFLAAKPSAALKVPTSLSDMQLLLSNEYIFNVDDPGLGEIATDDYYLTDADYTGSYTTQETYGYIWAKQVYTAGVSVPDWEAPYQQVYYSNVVLDGLSKMQAAPGQQTLYNQVKGTALFYRSIAFYNLVQTFAEPYNAATAATDPGIPLRLSSDINVKATRASQQQCYDQVLADLQTALLLLPVTQQNILQPSQPAVNGLLARIYLALGNYTKAHDCANACLQQNHSLVDYNTLSPLSYTISGSFLSEDIFHAVMQSYSIVYPNYICKADSNLYRSYVDNDLRKSDFFVLNNGLPYFMGTYDYQGSNYSGIATDEIYLTRAESSARLGDTKDAMTDLNTLLVTRWKTGTFVPYTASSADDALAQILSERRKELCFRGLRWTDLRRLNKDPRFAVTLKRILNGVTYTLPPNDPRYAWPIPDNEIANSGEQQNPR